MKKRKGLFLLEALLALLILASLAAALFPLAGQAAKAEILASVRGKLGNQGLFAMDFMVEKIRNNRRAMVLGGVQGNRYDYRAPTGQGTIGTYRLFEDQEKLKVQLYNDVIQPITGDRGGSVEEYVFRHPEGGHLFEQADNGPVTISFTLARPIGRESLDFETAVIPYADFYGKGKTYETGKSF